MLEGSPWTTIAALHAPLITALWAVTFASFQSVKLSRDGKHLEGLRRLHKRLSESRGNWLANKIQQDDIQFPVMVLTTSVYMLLVVLFIWLCDRGTKTAGWTDDRKVSRNMMRT